MPFSPYEAAYRAPYDQRRNNAPTPVSWAELQNPNSSWNKDPGNASKMIMHTPNGVYAGAPGTSNMTGATMPNYMMPTIGGGSPRQQSQQPQRKIQGTNYNNFAPGYNPFLGPSLRTRTQRTGMQGSAPPLLAAPPPTPTDPLTQAYGMLAA